MKHEIKLDGYLRGLRITSLLVMLLFSYSSVSGAEVGEVFTADNLVYKVIEKNGSEGKVQLGDGIKPMPLPGVNLKVPAIVNYDGLKLTVSRVGSFAFTTYEDESGGIAENGSNVEELTLPATIEELQEKSFYSAIYLRQIYFSKESQLKRIGEGAFNFSSLKGIDIPDTVTEIADGAFNYAESLGKVKISPNSELVTIGENAFSTNKALESIFIPKFVESIGGTAFRGIQRLAEVQVALENQAYSSEEGVLYTKDKKTLLIYPAKKRDYDFTTPLSVEKVANYSFGLNDYLAELTLNEGVTEIGDFAFQRVINMKKITLPQSLVSIGRLAFFDNWKLQELIIPDQVVILGKNPFYNLPELSRVYLGSSLTHFESGMFGGLLEGLAEVTIGASRLTLASDSFETEGMGAVTFYVTHPTVKDSLISSLNLAPEKIILTDPSTEPSTEPST
ncbi:leucine-rich repeat domain-containing protein, partial [Vagococcus salmoninarum]